VGLGDGRTGAADGEAGGALCFTSRSAAAVVATSGELSSPTAPTANSSTITPKVAARRFLNFGLVSATVFAFQNGG
jgi:hypothetical protein